MNTEVEPTEVQRREFARLDYEAQIQEGNDRLKYQVDFSQSLLRNMVLVNGGAIISLFTFIGNSQSQFDEFYTRFAFGSFAVALTATLFAYIGGFFSQQMFMEVSLYQAWNAQQIMHGGTHEYDVKGSLKRGNIAMWTALGLAFFGLIAFIVGAYCALEGVL